MYHPFQGPVPGPFVAPTRISTSAHPFGREEDMAIRMRPLSMIEVHKGERRWRSCRWVWYLVFGAGVSASFVSWAGQSRANGSEQPAMLVDRTKSPKRPFDTGKQG